MLTKTKKKFVNVVPKSKEASIDLSIPWIFSCMSSRRRKDSMYFLQSLNKKYYMWLPKEVMITGKLFVDMIENSNLSKIKPQLRTKGRVSGNFRIR